MNAMKQAGWVLGIVLAVAGGAGAASSETPFSPGAELLPPPVLAKTLAPAEHPLAGQIGTFLKRQASFKDFKPSGLTREDYLKVIAGEVKALRQYQNAEGWIIDPIHKQKYYAAPSYALAVATLAASGYDRDAGLLESGMKAMDVSTDDLVALKNNHYDFYTYPLMMALPLYTPLAAPERVARWRENLRQLDPARAYSDMKTASNWVIVNLSGDYLRAAAGLAPMDSVDERLATRFQYFSDWGSYQEGAAGPYDHFARYFLAGILQQGYQGRHFERLRDLIWKGAWTSLFLMSPTGEFPTAGRSSHHIWNEAQSCVTYEIYAAAYARAGRMAEAGAFKRAAHLSLRCVQNWLRPDGSGYIVKNRYPIGQPHAYHDYSTHVNYNLLACAMLAQAWQFADDATAERPAPVDVGGYVLANLRPGQKKSGTLAWPHKVYACIGGTYVEYNSENDLVYNPTGLLRIHVKGGHPQLGPSDGSGAVFNHTKTDLAVGPLWQDAQGVWRSLAEMRTTAPKVEILEETPERACFRVTYENLRTKDQAGPGVTVTETVTVEASGVTVRDEVSGTAVKAMRLCYPMLVFNGQEKTEIQLGGNSVKLRLEGKGVQYTVQEPTGVTLTRSGTEYKHWNGMVEPVYADIPGKTATYRIQAW